MKCEACRRWERRAALHREGVVHAANAMEAVAEAPGNFGGVNWVLANTNRLLFAVRPVPRYAHAGLAAEPKQTRRMKGLPGNGRPGTV
jgi:hypothetical protein